ncbi:MAG: S-layer homology domain-containing protein [Tumebacillaceae bacterium]
MTKKRITALATALLMASPIVQLPVAATAMAATQTQPPTQVLLHPDRTVTWKGVGTNYGYTVNVYNAADNKLVGFRSAISNAETLKLDDLMKTNGIYYVRIITRGNGMSSGYSDSVESAKSNELKISYSITLPEPEKAQLAASGIATWIDAANNGYTLNIYHAPSNTLVIAKDLEKDANSCDISKLVPATGQYYVKLIAKGDNLSMTDSKESEASNAQTITKAEVDLKTTVPQLNYDRTATWTNVEGNVGYRIGVYKENGEVAGFLQAPKDATSLDLSSLIKQSGKYYVKIMTLGKDNANSADSEKSNVQQYFLEPHLLAVPEQLMTLTDDKDAAIPQTKIELNDALVQQQLNAQTDAYHLLVYSPETVSSHLYVDGAILETMASRSPDAKLLLQTDLGKLEIPVAQLQQMSRDHSVALGRNRLVVDYALVQATVSNGQTVNPVHFGLQLVDPVNQVVVADFSDASSYLAAEVNYTLNSSLNPKTLASVRIDDQGRFQPVPATIQVAEDGKLTVTYRYRGTGSYGLMPNAKQFPDVLASYYAKPSIESLATRMVINGFEDGTFRPNDTVTRAEFATMLVKALGLKSKSVTSGTFSDVAVDNWFAANVSTAYDAGLIAGKGDGKFAPNDLITHQEMASMVARALRFAGGNTTVTAQDRSELLGQLAVSNTISDWAKDSVALCLKNSILTGNTRQHFTPNTPADRGMAADVLYRMMKTLNFAD